MNVPLKSSEFNFVGAYVGGFVEEVNGVFSARIEAGPTGQQPVEAKTAHEAERILLEEGIDAATDELNRWAKAVWKWNALHPDDKVEFSVMMSAS